MVRHGALGILHRLDLRTGEWTFAGGWPIDEVEIFPVADVWSVILRITTSIERKSCRSFPSSFFSASCPPRRPEAEQTLFEADDSGPGSRFVPIF